MLKASLAATGLGLGLMALLAPTEAAAARNVGHGGHGAPARGMAMQHAPMRGMAMQRGPVHVAPSAGRLSNRWVFRPGHGYRPGRTVFYSAPFYAYDYDYGYVNNDDDDCRWLLRRARETGSRTWWRRYYQCME